MIDEISGPHQIQPSQPAVRSEATFICKIKRFVEGGHQVHFLVEHDATNLESSACGYRYWGHNCSAPWNLELKSKHVFVDLIITGGMWLCRLLQVCDEKEMLQRVGSVGLA